MKRMLLLAGLVLMVGWGCDRKPAADGGDGLRIAVIPKGTTHDFWKSVHAGAVKAAAEHSGVTVIFKGPEREDNREQQVTLVENFLTSDVSAIVLAPLDAQALLKPVQESTKAGIPVVIIDSGLAGEVGDDFVSFVATDNYQGGKLAGQRIGELLDGRGKVLLLRYAEGSASTMQREQGFIDALKQFPDIELVDPGKYAGATRDTAQKAADDLLGSPAAEDLTAVFCPNESSTYGMLLALRARDLTGRVKFVGFDASPGLVEALEAGDLQGLVVQNPFHMGYMGVKTAVQHLRGEEVEPRIDTGVALVTPDNIDEPRIQELIHPDLEKYLGQ